MARFVTGNTFGTTDTVTATTLNNAVNNAKISADSVDDSTIELNSDALRLKDSGITTAKLADSSSKTTGVTLAKMQHISTAKVLGRSTAGEGDVEELDLKDEDDMSSDSATALASQQSIKAFVEKFKPNIVQTVKTDTANTSGTSFASLMSVSITPKFENSKFKISFSVCTSSNTASYGPSFRLQRNGSDLTSFLADSAGSRPQTTISTHYPGANTSQSVQNFTALDSTSYSGLSAITFELDWAMTVSGIAYLNRSNVDTDSASYTRSVSQLMVEEIYQ